ncbi:MAG: PA2928 family protein [Ferruginibacter sp.]
MARKIGLSIAVAVIAMIAGMYFLMRGCLSAYDERSATGKILYFEKDGKSVVCTIVKYDAATSYRSGGGITSKTVSTSYYIQSNDAVTGEKRESKKISAHSSIKNYPVSVMGAGGGKAWLFVNEPLAYDPFTLEKLADKAAIEARNPALKGKMPDEHTYYVFDPVSGTIIITATDGQKYQLSCSSLLATPIDEEEAAATPVERMIRELTAQQKEIDDAAKEFYAHSRALADLYREHKITYAAYMDSNNLFYKTRDTLDARRRKLSEEISDWEDLQRGSADQQNRMKSLNERSSPGFTDMSTSADTFKHQWYGLLNPAGLDKFYNRFEYRPVYTETDRNRLYSAAIRSKDSSRKAAELLVGEPRQVNAAVYLQGGFFQDKTRALPFHLKAPDGFIVCYRDKVGSKANVMLARIDLLGNILWNVNTGLDHFIDWTFSDKTLCLLGVDNKELSSDEGNVLHIIDLKNGAIVTYDYYTDKMRAKK